MLNHLKPGKTFYKNLLTLCLAFLMAVVLLIPAYSLALQSANKQSVNTIQYNLDVAAKKLDDEGLKLMAVNEHLHDPAVYQIKNATDEDVSLTKSYNLLRCKSLFKMMTVNPDIAFEYMWLFTNNSHVITSGFIDAIYSSYSDCFKYHLRFVGNNSQTMRQLIMNTTEKLTVLPSTELMINNAPQGECIIIVAHPVNCTSVYCALYRLSDLQTLFGLDNLPQNAFLVYTARDDSTIFHTGTGESNEEYTVLTSELTILGGTISIHLPESYFSAQVASVKRLLILYLIIAAIIGIVLSVFIAFFSYKPLYTLIRSTSDDNPYTDHKLLDEYAFLKEINTKWKFRQQEMLQQIASMRHSIRSVHLEQLLMNTKPNPSEQTIVEKYLPELKHECRLAIIDIGYDRSESEAEDTILTMLPVFEQNEIHMTYMGYGQIYTLFEDCNLMKFENAFVDINDAIQKKLSTKACATISSVFTGVEGLRQAFRAVQITAITSVHSIAYVQEQSFYTGDDINVDLNVFSQLIQSGNGSAAERFTINALNELLENGGGYDDVVRLYDMLRSKLITISSETCSAVDVSGFVTSMPIIEQFESIGIAASMVADRHGNKKDVPSYKNEMLEYINCHYTDANMYAGSIAEHFNVSTKQVYRVVRELTGTGFSDYVEDLRIKQAIKLLDESDSPVNNIAINCGFNSLNSFYRAFKRVYGISPTAYRMRTE